ncbi:MAG TPA: hypothetical protein V6C90_24670 [Coleofasciculaceae cyanobacterium]
MTQEYYVSDRIALRVSDHTLLVGEYDSLWDSSFVATATRSLRQP